MTLIAGHDFDSLDRCKTCPRTWFQIMHVTQDQIGEEGIAHIGALNMLEYLSIEERRSSERRHVWLCVVGSATGNGPAAAPVVDVDYSGAEAA